MMVIGVLGAFLSLALLASLIVLAWVAIGGPRREPPGTGASERR
jgi:hypothetical protein